MMRASSLRFLPLAIATSLLLLASACSSPAEDNNGNNTTPSPDMTSSGTEDMGSGEEDQGQVEEEDMTSSPEDLGVEEDMSVEADMADMPAESEYLEIPEGPWDITQKGPYNVGYTVTEMTYKIRPTMEDRTLKVVFWYPTKIKLMKRAAYFNGLLRRTNLTFDNPEVTDEPATFPVLVFSHGNGSIAEQSYFQSEHFASHGWVVVAPYHKNNTIEDNPSAINYGSAVERPQDITALIDWLEELPEDEKLHGRLELDKLAMSGHSFGAFTTMAMVGAQFAVDDLLAECEQGEIDGNYDETCEIFSEDSIELFRDGFYDARIKAAVPHTPGIHYVFRDEGMAAVTTPTLLMTAGRDRALPNADNGTPMFAAMQGEHARFDIPNGGHFTYSNMCGLLGGIEQAANDGCNETFIEEEIALPIINHYTMAWIHYHVLGHTEHEALLSGEVTPYEQDVVTYMAK
ncbi:MAG: hypothetical protein VYE40_08705 [Myxococcota bacterium]|nr:hypothetical protein [Myxococcota bacterium]